MDEYLKMFEENNSKYMGKCNGHIHVIKEGDTLYNLSKEYDVRLMDLMKLNPYVNVYNLQIGEELCIPVSYTPMEKYYTYNVKQGDTLDDIMKFFGTSFENLLRYNPNLVKMNLPEGMSVMYPMNNNNTNEV